MTNRMYSILLLVIGSTALWAETPNEPKNSASETSAKTLAASSKTKEEKPKVTIEPKAPNTKIEFLTLDDAHAAAAYYRVNGDKHLLFKTLERILALTTDNTAVEPLLREMIDVAYEQPVYPKAEVLGEQYLVFYPGSPSLDDIAFKLIQAIEKQIPIASRDQGKTKKAVEHADGYFKRFGKKGKHTNEITEIRTRCIKRLIESELEKAGFYLFKRTYTGSNGTLTSARLRLLRVRNKLLPQLTTALTDENKKLLDAIAKSEFTKLPVDEQATKLQACVDACMATILDENKVATSSGNNSTK